MVNIGLKNETKELIGLKNDTKELIGSGFFIEDNSFDGLIQKVKYKRVVLKLEIYCTNMPNFIGT